MAQISVLAGATSVSINLFVQDSSSTVGAGLGAIAPAGGSLLGSTIAYYSFSGANATATVISLSVLAAVNSAYSSGGIVTLDDTHMKGVIRLDLPNAALAASKGRSVTVYVSGGANMAPCVTTIALTGWDNQDGVHGGLSSLPNTAVTTNASLLTSGTGTDQLSVTSGRIDAGKILGTTISTPATSGILDVNVKNMNNVAATAITTIKAVQGLTTADQVTTVSGNVNGSVGSVTGAVGSVTGAVGSVTGAVGSVTGNVGGNVTGSVGSVTAAVAITSNVKKNQALSHFQFLMTDSTTHAPKTGLTVTCTRSIDGGAFGAGTLANVTEIANGTYTVDFGSGDLNGNVIVLRATAASSDDTFEQIITQP